MPAVAHQVFHASKILLYIHRTTFVPDGPGLTNCSFLSLRRRIEMHRWNIFWIANSKIPDSWGLVSTQCLYIAGLVTEGAQERQKTLDMIDQVQLDTGRRTSYLSHDLRMLWDRTGEF